MENQTKINLRNIDNWIRALYMVLFGLLSIASRIIVFIVSFMQFAVQSFGQGVSIWTCQAFLFLTYNNDQKPFPFSDWPEVELPKETIVEQDPSASEVDDIPTFVEKDDKKPEV